MKVGLMVGAGLVVGAAVALTAVALAAPAGSASGSGRRAGPAFGRWQREVGLSADQVVQLRKMWSDERKAAIRRRADIAIARIDLEEALQAPTVDEKAEAAREKVLSDLQAAVLHARVERRLALRRMLSPEQQQRLAQFWHERRG
jgi:Spy/CpxP family protein refolding chaperone